MKALPIAGASRQQIIVAAVRPARLGHGHLRDGIDHGFAALPAASPFENGICSHAIGLRLPKVAKSCDRVRHQRLTLRTASPLASRFTSVISRLRRPRESAVDGFLAQRSVHDLVADRPARRAGPAPGRSRRRLAGRSCRACRSAGDAGDRTVPTSNCRAPRRLKLASPIDAASSRHFCVVAGCLGQPQQHAVQDFTRRLARERRRQNFVGRNAGRQQADDSGSKAGTSCPCRHWPGSPCA